MVRFYEQVNFPLYAILTFTYLFITPFLLDLTFYAKIPDFSSKEFVGFFSIHGILPVLGSYLGYRWLSSVLHSLSELVDKQVLEKEYCKSVKETLINDCNKILFIPFSLFFLGCVILYDKMTFVKEYGSIFAGNLITEIYIFITNFIWWYFIVKAALVCLITFSSYRNILLKKSSNKYVLEISIYHPDTYYGLASIGRYCINFFLFILE